jgi:hypothetical protein
MWLNKKLRIIQDEKWVVVMLKPGYRAGTFPNAAMVNFYKFIASLTTDPVGIYAIEKTQTGIYDDSYLIGNTAPPEKKIWKYERDTQRLFFATLGTYTGTTKSQNQVTDEIEYDLVLENVIATTNGFVVHNGDSGGYGVGEVLRKSWTEKPFKEKGKNLRWESGPFF